MIVAYLNHGLLLYIWRVSVKPPILYFVFYFVFKWLICTVCLPTREGAILMDDRTSLYSFESQNILLLLPLFVNKADVGRFIAWIESADWILAVIPSVRLKHYLKPGEIEICMQDKPAGRIWHLLISCTYKTFFTATRNEL